MGYGSIRFCFNRAKRVLIFLPKLCDILVNVKEYFMLLFWIFWTIHSMNFAWIDLHTWIDKMYYVEEHFNNVLVGCSFLFTFHNCAHKNILNSTIASAADAAAALLARIIKKRQTSFSINNVLTTWCLYGLLKYWKTRLHTVKSRASSN